MGETVSRAGDESVSRATRVRVVTEVLGAVATLLALGGIASAVILDPTFSWTSDALSDLGVRPRSAPVFNWGLILGGAVGVGYAAGLGRLSRSPGTGSGSSFLRERLVGSLRAIVLGLAMVAMAGVGAFDLTQPLHGPAAVGFYALITLLFAVDGLARRGARTGQITLAFVPVHFAVWTTFVWGAWPVTGLALPEVPGIIMLVAWVWLVGPRPVLDTLATDEH